MFHPVPADTLSDRVHAAIRDAILRGDFPPGTFLREEEIATKLGVSRTPVRESLSRLALEGFVERLARRGFRVPQVGVSQLLELYPIVAALEVLAGETSFPRLTGDDLVTLRALNREFSDAGEVGDAQRGLQANHQFHHVLSARCGNERLCTMLDDLRAQVARLEMWSARHAGHAVEATQQHEEILQHIERRDYTRALALLRVNRLQTYTAFTRELG